ncbi:MAG: dimethyl sulfoxide reductase subunit A, partial [Oscillospiraceae bacterium]|nr:dimethyl sulfoxide reductase subunit A [Oscillospiraceae bacterium]
RGLVNGQLAEVYNDRGVTRIPVFVTERIMRGVVAMAQGAWYTPDENGVDTRGSINVLTSSKPSPLARANPQHTNLVEVKACSK